MTTMRIYTTWRHDADAEDVGGVTTAWRKSLIGRFVASYGTAIAASAGRGPHHAIFLGVVCVWLDSAVADGVIRPATPDA